MTKSSKKPVKQNGFTLGEALMALLIVTIMTASFSVFQIRPSAASFMVRLQNILLDQQTTAIAKRSPRSVQIEESRIISDGQTYTLPDGITCQPAKFTFNDKGNVSSAGTITCQSSFDQAALIIQLGCGRMRIETE